MKRFSVILFLLASLSAFSQEKIKVAVLPVYDTNGNVESFYKQMIRNSLKEALSETKEYKAIDYEIIDKTIKVVKKSEEGYIKKEERRELGKMLGAQFVLYAEVDGLGNQIIISASLEDVETGEVEKNKSVTSEKDVTAVESACKRLTEKLFQHDTKQETNTFIDPRDGKVYKTVKIGSQTWMAENLNFYTNSGSWCYDHNNSYCDTYGRLYDWHRALIVCPQGWRLPAIDDFYTLLYSVGDSDIWRYRSLIKSGSSGFSAICSGVRSAYDDVYIHIAQQGWWWSSTSNSEDKPWHLFMDSDNRVAKIVGHPPKWGCSVRCLKE